MFPADILLASWSTNAVHLVAQMIQNVGLTCHFTESQTKIRLLKLREKNCVTTLSNGRTGQSQNTSMHGYASHIFHQVQ